MKKFDVCGIGNALVDVLVKVSEEDFNALGFERGSMRLVEESEQKETLRRVSQSQVSKHRTMASGGSVANSIIAVSQLGGKGAFCCHVADDDFGKFYRQEFEELCIRVEGGVEQGSNTGTCVALVTPDAERTMRVCLGATARLNSDDVSEELIKDSKWLFLEGYPIGSGEPGQSAILAAANYAKKHGTKIAFSCSEPFIVEVFSEVVEKVLSNVDLLLCNEKEAMMLSKCSDGTKAFEALKKRFSSVVVTLGADGALMRHESSDYKFTAEKCTPVDLTGAGDMFAACVLFGLTQGIPLPTVGKGAALLSSKVITQVGARLQSGVKEAWETVL